MNNLQASPYIAASLTAIFGFVSTYIFNWLEKRKASRNGVKLLLASLDQLSFQIEKLKETAPNNWFDLQTVMRITGGSLRDAEELAVKLAADNSGLSGKLLNKMSKIGSVITDIHLFETYPYIGITDTGQNMNISVLRKEFADIRLALLGSEIYLDANFNPKAKGADKAKKEATASILISDMRSLMQQIEERNGTNIQRRRDLLGKLTDVSNDISEMKRSISSEYRL